MHLVLVVAMGILAIAGMVALWFRLLIKDSDYQLYDNFNKKTHFLILFRKPKITSLDK